jgi:hypothetical protein
MVTQSATRDHAPAETGFLSVISVEPLYECLAHHKLMPNAQKESWDGFWNSTPLDYVGSSGQGQMLASLSLHDDGTEIYIDCHAHKNKALVEKIVDSLLLALGGWPTEIDRKREDWVRVGLRGDIAIASRLAKSAVAAADTMLLGKGLRRS